MFKLLHNITFEVIYLDFIEFIHPYFEIALDIIVLIFLGKCTDQKY
jgi:hypothetical protein